MDEATYITLQEELRVAKERHEAAKSRFKEVSRATYTAGIPSSDGNLLFRKALQEENVARSAHVAALMRLSEYLLNGTVPKHIREKRPH